MEVIQENLLRVKNSLPPHVTLVAISKTKPVEDIVVAYHAGQEIFGENKVQELMEKQELMPKDIQWHLVGHLQTNKVKYIAPFIALIHSVDSLKLLEEIHRQGMKINRKIPVLLQIYIAKEETKFGLDEKELNEILEHKNEFPSVQFCGLMGMATNTEDMNVVRNEFNYLKTLFDQIRSRYFPGELSFKEISMGMSSDYEIAIEEGSTMVRVGSSIFGTR
jgi:pyridoxal phosphate enzyme (YggS family)